MGPSCFLKFLFFAALLALSISNAFGRKLRDETVRFGVPMVQLEESEGILSRKILYQLLDYEEPKANTNPRSGFVSVPPPQPN